MTPENTMYRIHGKRLVDILLATIGFIVLSPLLGIIALIIKCDSEGPIIFRQERCGLGGAVFCIYKFRTMSVRQQPGAAQLTLGRDPRITRVGHFIRKYKLDELPQLINILRGDMSVVGPRPEVPRFMSKYSADQRDCILSVRPGMTDYASILFRDENSLFEGVDDPDRLYVETIMPRKFSYYRLYARRIGFFVDVQIIFETAVSVIAGHPTNSFARAIEMPEAER